MMTVEPTCRFCNRKMNSLTSFQSRGRTIYSLYCVPCRSEQLFEEDGKTLEYSFRVGDYLCQFNLPYGPVFRIVKQGMEMADLSPHKVVLKLDFIPENLTPQNTTIDKIKTMILFS